MLCVASHVTMGNINITYRSMAAVKQQLVSKQSVMADAINTPPLGCLLQPQVGCKQILSLMFAYFIQTNTNMLFVKKTIF